MKLKEETEGLIKLVIGVLISAALVIAAFVLGANELIKGIDVNEQPITETAPGMPLDAIQYDAPDWMPDARQVFEVTDRKNNVKWWVIRTSDYQWLTLPIGEYQDAG